MLGSQVRGNVPAGVPVQFAHKLPGAPQIVDLTNEADQDVIVTAVDATWIWVQYTGVGAWDFGADCLLYQHSIELPLEIGPAHQRGTIFDMVPNIPVPPGAAQIVVVPHTLGVVPDLIWLPGNFDHSTITAIQVIAMDDTTVTLITDAIAPGVLTKLIVMAHHSIQSSNRYIRARVVLIPDQGPAGGNVTVDHILGFKPDLIMVGGQTESRLVNWADDQLVTDTTAVFWNAQNADVLATITGIKFHSMMT